MVWNKTLPSTATKLRNTPSEITANWDAIESADTSFQPNAFILTDRNPLGVANNPSGATAVGTSRGNGYTLFCKQDASGKQELYGVDPSDVITQFTMRGRNLDQTGYALIPPGFLMQWGRATIPSGSQTVPVTFPVPFGAAPWVIHVTPYVNPTPGGGSNSREIGADTFTATDFNAKCFNGNVLQNTLVGWTAIGPVA